MEKSTDDELEYLDANKFTIERKPWEIYGVSRTTYWRWEKAGIVPKRIQLGPNTKGVLVEELVKDIAKKQESA